MAVEPKIQFSDLRGFPQISSDGKIETKEFLNAAREIVSLVEKFGKLFAPVVYDIGGNIEKLTKAFQQNENDFTYLEDLVRPDTNNEQHHCSREALLWLKRALEMFEKFFSNLLNDENCEENLKSHIKAAYAVTLKQYHGWIVQEAFGVIYRLLPYRSQLVGTGTANEANMKCLENLLPPMRANLQHVTSILTSFESNKKI